MPSILTNNTKVYSARNFLRNFYDNANENLYIGVGTSGSPPAWTTTAPVPENTYQEQKDFWQYLLGVAKVDVINDSEIVVPRKTWQSGTSYVVFDDTEESGTGTFDINAGRDFYVVNNTGKVYMCTAAGTSTVEPSHSDTSGTVESDGVGWKYLYSLGTDVADTIFSNSQWMPVPTLVSNTHPGASASIAEGELYMGDGSGSFRTDRIYYTNAAIGTTGATMDADSASWSEFTGDLDLGAFWAVAAVDLPGTGDCATEFGTGTSYVQIAALLNPKDNGGNFITQDYSGTQNTNSFESHTTLTKGVVLTIDNRAVISRSASQTETLRVLLEF
jgi:hypothetical protein